MPDPVAPPANPVPTPTPAPDPPVPAPPAAPPAAPPVPPIPPPAPVNHPAPEMGPDGKPKGDVQTPPGDAKPTPNAPAKYEFTPPEGMQFDQASMDLFEPVARELDLTQEQASKLVSVVAEIEKAKNKGVQDLLAGWTETAQKDPEIGGVGGKDFATNIALADKAITKFGTEALKADLAKYGMGSNPEFIRFAVRLGKAMSEDNTNLGGNPSGTNPDLAHQMYPGLK